MNLITCCLALSIAASAQALPGRYDYKENSLQVTAGAYWEIESCPIPSSIAVLAGDGFIRQGIRQTYPTKAMEVYGEFFTDCSATAATRLSFYLFQEGADVTFDRVDRASLSVSETVILFKSPCTVETIVEEGGTFTTTSCSDSDETFTEESLTFDLTVETAGLPYLLRSKDSSRGIGFASRSKSRSRCKQQAFSSWSNVVVGDYRFTVEVDDFGGGDICRVMEGYYDRFIFAP